MNQHNNVLGHIAEIKNMPTNLDTLPFLSEKIRVRAYYHSKEDDNMKESIFYWSESEKIEIELTFAAYYEYSKNSWKSSDSNWFYAENKRKWISWRAFIYDIYYDFNIDENWYIAEEDYNNIEFIAYFKNIGNAEANWAKAENDYLEYIEVNGRQSIPNLHSWVSTYAFYLHEKGHSNTFDNWRQGVTEYRKCVAKKVNDFIEKKYTFTSEVGLEELIL